MLKMNVHLMPVPWRYWQISWVCSLGRCCKSRGKYSSDFDTPEDEIRAANLTVGDRVDITYSPGRHVVLSMWEMIICCGRARGKQIGTWWSFANPEFHLASSFYARQVFRGEECLGTYSAAMASGIDTLNWSEMMDYSCFQAINRIVWENPYQSPVSCVRLIVWRYTANFISWKTETWARGQYSLSGGSPEGIWDWLSLGTS